MAHLNCPRLGGSRGQKGAAGQASTACLPSVQKPAFSCTAHPLHAPYLHPRPWTFDSGAAVVLQGVLSTDGGTWRLFSLKVPADQDPGKVRVGPFLKPLQWLTWDWHAQTQT